MKAHCPRSEATFERQRRTNRNIPDASPSDRLRIFIETHKYQKFYTKVRQNLP